jgi:hypothetical protein
MIYGRKILESKKFVRSEPIKQVAHPKITGAASNFGQFYYRDLSHKHILACILAAMGSIILFLGPAAYFLQDNYSIFYKLAYETQPGLVQHLERELAWFYILAIFACVSSAITTYWLVSRLMKSLLTPLKNLERHLHQSLEGEWLPTPEIKPESEFPTLLESYRRFQLYLKNSAVQDLEFLGQIQIDPNDKLSSSVKSQLIENKKKFLNQLEKKNIISLGEDSFSLHSKRRVS